MAKSAGRKSERFGSTALEKKAALGIHTAFGHKAARILAMACLTWTALATGVAPLAAAPPEPGQGQGSAGQLGEISGIDDLAPDVTTNDLIGPSDLRACLRSRDELPVGSEIDIPEFASRLHGIWYLSSRTIRGLPIDAKARFYFHMEEIEEDVARGAAILIDYGNLAVLDPLGLTAECPADATVAALWEVEISKKENRQLSLVMEGEYFGSYGDLRRGMTATESSVFYRYGENYLSGRLSTPSGGEIFPDDVWDRVDFNSESLVYVSCKNGYMERYVKTADVTPALDGLPLREAWANRKKNGSLIVPVPVPSIWKDEGEQAGE